jgi:FKBP-type peptidyl-prolyl cis-trans isomerase
MQSRPLLLLVVGLTIADLGVHGCRRSRPRPVPPEPGGAVASVAPAAPDDVAAPPAAATRTASGLAFVVSKGGSGGERPRPGDSVKVRYTGWTPDGHRFGGTDRNGPLVLPLEAAIRGWQEVLPLMSTGEQRRIWVPAGIAYGIVSRRADAPAGPLTFDLELLAVYRPPAAPPGLGRPPASARRTHSGLTYQVLRKGTGAGRPMATSLVQVHYTGWTAGGKMFDSSVARGLAPTFPVDGVMPGWTEGLQLMVVGEKARFWVPTRLAYGARPESPGTPAGPLVFDLELLAIR